MAKRVSVKAVQKLLQDTQWAIDLKLTQPDNKIYRHTDGRLLISLMDGKANLIDANEVSNYMEMVEATKRFIKENPHGRHVLIDRLPQGANFVAYVPALIAELPSLLNLPHETFDFSVASLAKIDPKLKRQGRVKCTAPPLFPSLVAYVGEIYNRKTGSRWYIRHNTMDVRVWEPWLVRKDAVCNLAGNLFDGLIERSLSLSVLIGGPWIWWREHK